MESLGQFLKTGREQAGLSLNDLAARTRIRQENLGALEREDLTALPSEPYVRGFIRLVCRDLGLPAQEGLSRYDALRAQSGPLDEVTWEEERSSSSAGFLERVLADPERVVTLARRGGRVALSAAAVVAAVLLVVTAWSGIRGWRERASERAELAAVAEPAPKPDPPAGVAESTPEPAALDPPPASETVVTDAPSRRPETTSSPPPADDPGETVAVDVHEPEVVEREVVETVTPEPDLEPPKPGPIRTITPRPSGERLSLRVEAVRDVDVAVLLDGVGVPRRRRLDAGTAKTWKADSVFVVSASDAGAIRLVLEGRVLGIPGNDGEPLVDRTVRAVR